MITTDKDENFTDIKKHIQRLVKHIKHRKIATEQNNCLRLLSLNIVQQQSGLFLRGAELPKCENCEIIKASEFK